MNEVIIVKPEKCVGCNSCVRNCPAPEANTVKQLDDGRFIVSGLVPDATTVQETT